MPWIMVEWPINIPLFILLLNEFASLTAKQQMTSLIQWIMYQKTAWHYTVIWMMTSRIFRGIVGAYVYSVWGAYALVHEFKAVV